MLSCVRRCTLFLVLAALVLAVGGCSKDKKTTEAGLTQAQADDLMQGLAAMAAIDRGGWMVSIESSLESHPRSNLSASPGPQPRSVLARDTSFTVGTDPAIMAWHFSYTYYDTTTPPAPISAWDGSIRYYEAACRATGSLTVPDFLGSVGSGDYGHVDTLLVDGFRDATSSTLSFNGSSAVDSAFITITSGNLARYYYFDNIVDLAVEMPKNLTLPALPDYPLSGELRVDTFVDVLGSALRTDHRAYLDANMTIAFDGTETPRASITANTENATEVFHYTLNLKTGQITR
jgi:hypothetical protein